MKFIKIVDYFVFSMCFYKMFGVNGILVKHVGGDESGCYLLSERRPLLWRCQIFDERTRWRVCCSANPTSSLVEMFLFFSIVATIFKAFRDE